MLARTSPAAKADQLACRAARLMERTVPEETIDRIMADGLTREQAIAFQRASYVRNMLRHARGEHYGAGIVDRRDVPTAGRLV